MKTRILIYIFAASSFFFYTENILNKEVDYVSKPVSQEEVINWKETLDKESKIEYFLQDSFKLVDQF